MEAYRTRRRSSRLKCVSTILAVVVAVIIAIAVPLAVIFSRRNGAQGFKSTFLIPLYIFPAQGAWDPLFDVVASRPKQKFAVIINPNNGPGNTSRPQPEYVSQLRKLTAYQNVRRLGYVRTTYGKRNISNIISDISTYGGWSAIGQGVHGIFFDEAPSEYSPGLEDYVKRINQAAKTAPGLLPDRLTIHNPGVVPDRRLNDTNTDATVVYEGPYSSYQSQQARLASLPYDRSRYSNILHSVPSYLKGSELKKFVSVMSIHAEYFYMTDLSENYYEKFGPRFKDYIDAIPN